MSKKQCTNLIDVGVFFSVVMDKCLTSEECLSKLGPKAEGKELLVPLSNSVYVPGYLTNAEKAIIGKSPAS